MDYFLGCISIFPFGFAPKGWFMCQGQLLPINQYQALFALIGTTYGGNGVTTFALPDLRGRTPIGSGQSISGSVFVNGEPGGTENVTLNNQQLPIHTHMFGANTGAGTAGEPGDILASLTGLTPYAAPDNNMTTLNPGTITPLGTSSTPHNNLQPYLTLNFCIAYTGIFPSRN
jgi:microcystin-dependent protein